MQWNTGGINDLQEGMGPVPDAASSSASRDWKSFCSKYDVHLDRGALVSAIQNMGEMSEFFHCRADAEALWHL